MKAPHGRLWKNCYVFRVGTCWNYWVSVEFHTTWWVEISTEKCFATDIRLLAFSAEKLLLSVGSFFKKVLFFTSRDFLPLTCSLHGSCLSCGRTWLCRIWRSLDDEARQVRSSPDWTREPRADSLFRTAKVCFILSPLPTKISSPPGRPCTTIYTFKKKKSLYKSCHYYRSVRWKNNN